MATVMNTKLFDMLQNVQDGYEGAAAQKLNNYENELINAINKLLQEYDYRKARHHNTTARSSLFSPQYFNRAKEAQEVTTFLVHVTHPFLPLAALAAAANIGSFAAAGIGHLCNGIDNLVHRKLDHADQVLNIFGDKGESRDRIVRIVARLTIHELKDKLVHLKDHDPQNNSVAMYLAANLLHGIKKHTSLFMDTSRDDIKLAGAVYGANEGLTHPDSHKVKNHRLNTDNGESLSLKQLAQHRLI